MQYILYLLFFSTVLGACASKTKSESDSYVKQFDDDRGYDINSVYLYKIMPGPSLRVEFDNRKESISYREILGTFESNTYSFFKKIRISTESSNTYCEKSFPKIKITIYADQSGFNGGYDGPAKRIFYSDAHRGCANSDELATTEYVDYIALTSFLKKMDISVSTVIPTENDAANNPSDNVVNNQEKDNELLTNEESFKKLENNFYSAPNFTFQHDKYEGVHIGKCLIQFTKDTQTVSFVKKDAMIIIKKDNTTEYNFKVAEVLESSGALDNYNQWPIDKSDAYMGKVNSQLDLYSPFVLYENLRRLPNGIHTLKVIVGSNHFISQKILNEGKEIIYCKYKI